MSSQRLHSSAGSSCSHRCQSSRHVPLLHNAVIARARRNLQVSARVATAPKVLYMPNFLSKDDFAAVQKEARRMQPKLREELNCIAEGRLGCYLEPSSYSAKIFNRREVAAALSQRLRTQYPLQMSDFPIELRQYPKGAAMPWHLDEQMYAMPQWEIIYTIDNSSDSTTEWRDSTGKSHSIWTEPNSLLAVEAEGWEHRVLPVKIGVRTILKMAFASSLMKLPAFEANLTREAYAQ